MKSYKHLASAAAFCAVSFAGVLPANAQSGGTSTPIVVRQTNPKPSKAVWLKGEVVHADRNSIIVREQDNLVAIHTFTYSAQLKPKMEALASQGGFQAGNKVKILYLPGQTVALKVHGKPSKAS